MFFFLYYQILVFLSSASQGQSCVRPELIRDSRHQIRNLCLSHSNEKMCIFTPVRQKKTCSWISPANERGLCCRLWTARVPPGPALPPHHMASHGDRPDPLAQPPRLPGGCAQYSPALAGQLFLGAFKIEKSYFGRKHIHILKIIVFNCDADISPHTPFRYT